MEQGSGSLEEDEPTSVRLRRAAAGELDSLGWVVERFTPLLLAQAHQRIGAALRRRISAVDLVQEVWAIALPRLHELVSKAGRTTPVLVKFLATVCDLRIRGHLRALRREQSIFEGCRHEVLEGLSDEQSGLVTRVARRELFDRVRAAMDSLAALDREILLLRVLEQRSGAEVAGLLGMRPNAVYVRQHRALAALRDMLANDLFEDLARDPGSSGGGA